MAEGQEAQDLQEIEEGNANGDFSEQPTTENMDTNDQTTGDATISDDGTNEDDRKVFVGGLSWETTVKDLKEFFSKYGDVVNCTLKTDLETKRSRGFGFVVFSKTETVDTVLNTKEELKLHGKTIEPKRANPRTGSRKIFVGRVDPAYPEDDIKAYFSTFGKVEKIDLPFDKMKAQRRAFVFVEFETEEAMKKVLNQETHKLGTQEVDIKKATPTQGTGRGGMRGGRGGGRGSWNQGWGNQGYGSQGYGYGYDQSYGYGGYGGGYGGYGDYNQGYGYGGAWNQYNPGYANYGYGYDYSGWGGYGQDQTQQQSSYGKTGGNKRGGNSYHPYSH